MGSAGGPTAEDESMEACYLTERAPSLVAPSLVSVDTNIAAVFSQVGNRRAHYKLTIQALTRQFTLQIFIREVSSRGVIFSECFYILNI